MDWKRFQEQIPEKNTLCIVFQYKRRRYVVGRYGLYLPKHKYSLKDEIEPISPTTCSEGNPTWFSESGNRLSVNPDDHWCYIEPVTIKKTYN